MKNNILHTKGIMNSYSEQYIDHNLFKETLLNNDKPQKVSFKRVYFCLQKVIVIFVKMIYRIINIK